MDINVNVNLVLDEKSVFMLKKLFESATKTEAIDTAKESPKTDVSEPQAEEKPEKLQSKITIDDVRKALQGLKTKKDTAAAKEILESLGFVKVSEIPETDYEKVIQAIKEAA